MVGLVVDNKDILRVCQLAQHLTGIGFIAFDTALVNTAALLHSFLAVPGQRLPVGDQYLALAQLVHQTHWHYAKLGIIVVLTARLQDLQTTFDRQARCNNKHILGKPFILGISGFITDHPRNQHGHDGRLSATGAELGADAPECAAVAGNINADTICLRRFRQPDQRLHSVHLAKEKLILPGILVVPVLQQLFGHTGDTWIPRFPPRLNAGADRIHQRQLHKLPDVVVLVGPLPSHKIACRTAA